MVRRQFDTGINLGPFFAQTLIDAMIPKAIQKQHQQQVYLAKLAELEPKIAGLPEEEQNKWKNLLFSAHGVYKPGLIRGSIFGAADEPIAPLPEGTKVTSEFKKGPFGLGGRMQEQIITPRMEPFNFPQKPLFSVAHQQELDKALDAAGYTPQQRKDILAEATYSKVNLFGRSTSAQEAFKVGRAARFRQQYKMTNPEAQEEEVIGALRQSDPEAAIAWEQRSEQWELKKEIGKAGITEKEEKAKIAVQAEERKKLEGDRRFQMDRATLQFKKEASIRTAQNVKAAMLLRNENDLNRAVNTAYATYMRGVLAHNERERRMANDARYSGVPYLPQLQDLMDEKMWLRSEEGMPFTNKINALPGGGGIAETPLPMQRIDKINKFEQKHGVRR